MYKPIIFILITMYFLTLTACDQYKDFYKFEDECIKLFIPNNWQVHISKSDNKGFIFDAEKTNDSFQNRFSLRLITIPKPPGDDLDIIQKRFLDRDSDFKNLLVDNSIKTDYLGKGKLTVSQLQLEPSRLRRAYFFIKASYVILIDAEFPKENRKEIEPTFDKIVNSIELYCPVL
ncbi:hypothetical protein [Fulvivirga ligni]|uniref:hypothetical protein n=1 Tax=Fulvivirga ligni TaxID=2904246 RepID=UPI001F1F038A|nr:hypothetical protein [Fulvivirga ligni]UII20269.1 hypothetical protein LVD16_20720 [Fulvivirga ligni]